MDQALQRAVDNGVKNLIVQPTHLMHGAEYDELSEAVASYSDKFESVSIAEPLLGEVGSADDSVNSDKEAVAKAVTAEAVKLQATKALTLQRKTELLSYSWDTEPLIPQNQLQPDAEPDECPRI